MPESDNGLRVMWTDSPNAMALLEQRRQRRDISESEYTDLAFFIDHGWLIWRGAFPEPLIDRFATDVRNHHAYPGKFLTTNLRNRKPG